MLQNWGMPMKVKGHAFTNGLQIIFRLVKIILDTYFTGLTTVSRIPSEIC